MSIVRSKKACLLIVALAALFGACDESVTTTLSVGDDFSDTEDSIMVASLEEGDGALRLKGNLELLYGEFEFKLRNPNNVVVMSRTYNAVANVKIDTTFSPIVGNWKFSYVITQDEDDNDPSGSFDFSLIY